MMLFHHPPPGGKSASISWGTYSKCSSESLSVTYWKLSHSRATAKSAAWRESWPIVGRHWMLWWSIAELGSRALAGDESGPRIDPLRCL